MYLFTSESVSPGHPDKVADIIADTIVDTILKNDKNARIASEVFVAGKHIIIGGEVTSTYHPDYENIVVQAMEKIGYTDNNIWTDEECIKPQNIDIKILINKQSPDINQGVDKDDGEIGAGDQGIMFGYADVETDNYMPSAITYSRMIMEDIYNYALENPDKIGIDIKTQVTVDYETKDNFENSKPVTINTIVCSAPSKLPIDILRKLIEDRIRNHSGIPVKMLKNTTIHINPTGRYVNHSPLHDSGLTGRKLIVDSFGGYAPIGGGAQSSKDYTKVDRSGLYAGRWLAKNIVSAGFAKKCSVQLSYAIGISKPISINVDTYGTGNDEKISKFVLENFPLTPSWITKKFKLDEPGKEFTYADVAARGQVGQSDYPWEKIEPNLFKID